MEEVQGGGVCAQNRFCELVSGVFLCVRVVQNSIIVSQMVRNEENLIVRINVTCSNDRWHFVVYLHDDYPSR